MKYGINLKIDVTKLDKSRFFHADSGAIYADLTTFIDTENTGQYGDHGAISQSKKKDENIQMPFVGNAKIFWSGEGQSNQTQNSQPQNNNQPIPDDDIPF